MPDPHLAQARERLGHVLKERWVLEDVIGVGGMAAVYRARHRNGMRAAIKVLHGPFSEDGVVRERFLREAYLANSLEHAGTVHVLDDDADPKLGPYLIMELLDGSSLLELLDRGVTFDVPAVLDIADQALDVLAAAHQRNIVHRDLKPANLFLCRNGQLKVLDFGIARVLEVGQARLTRTGVPMGTPAYMAPEQARGLGRDADGRADLYALGATLFRLLAGRHVHVGRGAEQIALVATTRATKLASVAPHVPPLVAAVVDRSLEFEPERRYESARAMQQDVRALQRGDEPPIASVPLAPPGPVPALPPLAPRKRTPSIAPIEQDAPPPSRDAVTELAESLRQSARAIARRPDAFTVMPSSLGGDDEEDDDDMPTLVGSPSEMEVGAKPTSLADLAARAAAPPGRRPPGAPAPRRSPSSGRFPRAGGTHGTAAAQAFARVPNVPVPRVPAPREVDLEAPTLARPVAPAPAPPPPQVYATPPPAPIAPKFTPPRIAYVEPVSSNVAASGFSPPSIPPAPPSASSAKPAVAPAPTPAEAPRSRLLVVAVIALIVVVGGLLGLLAAKL